VLCIFKHPVGATLAVAHLRKPAVLVVGADIIRPPKPPSWMEALMLCIFKYPVGATLAVARLRNPAVLVVGADIIRPPQASL